jgi:hypothetical protein
MNSSQIGAAGKNNQLPLQTAKVGKRPTIQRHALASSQGTSPTQIFDKRAVTGRFNMRDNINHNKLTQHLLLDDSRVSLSAFGSQGDPISH